MCPPVGVQKGHLKLGGRVRAEHAGGTQGRVRAYPPGHRGAFHLEPSAALFALGQDGQHGPRRGVRRTVAAFAGSTRMLRPNGLNTVRTPLARTVVLVRGRELVGVVVRPVAC